MSDLDPDQSIFLSELFSDIFWSDLDPGILVGSVFGYILLGYPDPDVLVRFGARYFGRIWI